MGFSVSSEKSKKPGGKVAAFRSTQTLSLLTAGGAGCQNAIGAEGDMPILAVKCGSRNPFCFSAHRPHCVWTA